MEQILAPFTDLVISDLLEVEKRMRDSAHEADPHLHAAIEQILNSGGKRLRPILTMLCGKMLWADRERTITLAAAIEMLHTATLVHDDLIDGALMRRGNPTLNSQWSPNATVLTGDYIFARAAHLAAETGSLELMKIFAQKLMTMVNGEIIQHFRTSTGDLRRDYFQRIYAKTASLFEIAANGPAILRENGIIYRDELKAFGCEVGMAFQIMDDILDFVSNEGKLGKPVASDLRQGIITLPSLLYFEKYPDDPVIKMILNGHFPNSERLEGLIANIKQSALIDQSHLEAKAYIASAKSRLFGMPDNSNRDALIDLADYIIQRPF